jgi:hypothetical protein
MRGTDTASTHGERGLALIELLVALVLLALMSTLLLAALSTGRQVLDVSERRQSEPSSSATEALLRDLFDGARALPPLTADQQTPMFVGKVDQATFLAVIEKRGHYAGLYRVTIGLSPKTASSPVSLDVVLEAHRPGQTIRTAALATTRVVVLKDVKSVTLNYFGSIAPNRLPQWHAAWTDPQRLPQLISLKIEGVGLTRHNPMIFALPAAE